MISKFTKMRQVVLYSRIKSDLEAKIATGGTLGEIVALAACNSALSDLYKQLISK